LGRSDSPRRGNKNLRVAEGVEGGASFVVEGTGFGGLFAEAFDDMGGGFADELLVGEAGVVGGEDLLVLGELFGEALALGGDVDLLFVDDGQVEVGGGAGVGAAEGVGGDLDGFDTGEAGEDVLAKLERIEHARAGVDADGRGLFFGNAEFFAQGADGGDEFLQGLHLGDGRGVAWEVRGLGVGGEGDGFGRGKAGVERVPDLFGEEGHEGRQQAERGLEDGGQRGERGGGFGEGLFGGVAGGDDFAGDFEVEAELDDLEVPVAEVAPEELVDGVGGFVETVVGERGVDGGGGLGEAGEDPAGFDGVGGGESGWGV